MNKANYKYLIAAVMFAGLMVQNILWFAPAPFLSVIVEELEMSMMQGGLVVSIVGLMTALAGAFMGEFFGRIGVRRTFAAALVLMVAGSFLNLFVSGFYSIMLSRILMGMGFGFCLPVAGSVIMTFFPANQRPYLNTVNSLLPYFATVVTFSLTIPLFLFFGGSWRIVMAMPGILALGALVIWLRLYQEKRIGEFHEHHEQETRLSRHALREVLKNREVRLITVAEICDLWSFQFTTTYLPTFFFLEAGLSLSRSNSLMSLFPVAGILAGIGCGIWMSRCGLRKPFTWPLHTMIFVGTTLALFGTGYLRILGVFLAGFGNAGWAPALFTMPMEFENMTPQKVGVVYSLMLSTGFFASFVSPFLGGYLTHWLSLRTVIFLFSTSSLIAAGSTFLMRETGCPRRARATLPESP